MIVLGVSGWKGSGKDTVANYLVAEHGYKRMAFADVLKEMVAEQYNINVEMTHIPELKESPLLHLPVESRDMFSKLIHEFMAMEFRTKEGETPTVVSTSNGVTMGRIDRDGGDEVEFKPVYWTPRALCILEGSIKRAVSSSYWVQRVINQIETMSKKDNDLRIVISDMRYRSEVDQLREAFGNNLVTCRIKRFSSSPSNDPSERDLDDSELDFNVPNFGYIEDLYKEVDDMVSVSKGFVG